MLDFGMETKRICDIITRGAATRMNDVEFLEKEVGKFIASPMRKMMIDGDMYYDYEQAVRVKQRVVISEENTLITDPRLPNNRFCDNQYAVMVDQKVNYLLSKPVTFKTDNAAYADALRKVMDKSFKRTLKNVGKDSYNGGIGWMYPYYDETGAFKIKRFHPWEILPFWNDDDHTELDFAVRVYTVLAYEGKEEKKKQFVEVYDTKGIHRFEYESGKLIPDYSISYFELKTYTNPEDPDMVEGYNWNRVPLIPFRANSTETPLIKKCKELQDGINQILSDFGDGMQENASGNSILVIHNYGGTDLGEFRRNLMTYRAVKVENVDNKDGGIDTLTIEVNGENYKAVLQELRKALIQNCKGYDVEELKSSGSPNEMTIKAIFSAIDMDANEIETEDQASFEQLLWFVNMHLLNTGAGNFTDEEVDVIFNRDMMVNESQIITDCRNSVCLISQKTIIANHPWTVDPDAEMEQLMKENEEKIEQYQGAFAGKPDAGEDDDDIDDDLPEDDEN